MPEAWDAYEAEVGHFDMKVDETLKTEVVTATNKSIVTNAEAMIINYLKKYGSEPTLLRSNVVPHLETVRGLGEDKKMMHDTIMQHVQDAEEWCIVDPTLA